MSEVEQLAKEHFRCSGSQSEIANFIENYEENIETAYIAGYAKGETDEKFRTKQVVTKDTAEVAVLRKQVFIARGLLEKWFKQHSDKDYTATFYDELIKATDEFLWSDVCVK